jgi:hypothetical protein
MLRAIALQITLVAASLLMLSQANAVPSFARQTGMACSSCHTVFPELNAFGRQFKLSGYTLTNIKQIESSPADNNLKINETMPLSVMLQSGFTHVNKTVAGTQNNNIQFPQQLSLFYAGEIADNIGSFIQITYDQESDKLNWDNTDIRYATDKGNNTFGVTLNNGPTVQDVWNSTPAWGYPWAGSASAPGVTANATTLLEALGQDSAGLGGYALWNNSIYTELTLYRSAHLGSTQPDASSVNTLKGAAPYWRVAWQNQLANGNYLMIGTYGMTGTLYPTGVSGPTDHYTDAAVDAQYEHSFSADMLSVHFNVQHEKQALDASSPGFSPTVKTVKLDGTYHWENHATATLAFWKTTGDSGDYSTAPFGYLGSPDNNGFIAQASYLPWQNTKFTAQYTSYSKFDNLPAGSAASDFNTLFLQAWLMW